MNQEVKITSILAAYACAIGGCYSIGFWAPFRINIFQFASLVDLVKTAILPLFVLGAGYVLGSGFSSFSGVVESTLQRLPPAVAARPPRVFLIIYNHRVLVRNLWLLSLISTYLAAPNPAKWTLISILGMPAGLAVPETPKLREAIPNSRLRSFAVMTAAGLPFVALGIGATEAIAITSGHGNYLATPKAVGLDERAGPVDYLGLVGATYFFYVRDSKSIVVLKQTDGTPLNLQPNPSTK